MAAELAGGILSCCDGLMDWEGGGVIGFVWDGCVGSGRGFICHEIDSFLLIDS